MKIKHQLSIATLLMAGVLATGCSQQSAGGSQEAGSQQVSGGDQVSGSQQVDGGSQQVDGGSQQSSSQQQVEAAEPIVEDPAEPTARPAVPPPRVTPKRANPWAHTHPAVPRCTKSVRHTHKYNNAQHSHRYSCGGMRPATARPATVDVFALQRKLKAKGYYKGPIDGIVGPGTRSALQRFMKR